MLDQKWNFLAEWNFLTDTTKGCVLTVLGYFFTGTILFVLTYLHSLVPLFFPMNNAIVNGNNPKKNV
jgi:hypothetical protein